MYDEQHFGHRVLGEVGGPRGREDLVPFGGFTSKMGGAFRLYNYVIFIITSNREAQNCFTKLPCTNVVQYYWQNLPRDVMIFSGFIMLTHMFCMCDKLWHMGKGADFTRRSL